VAGEFAEEHRGGDFSPIEPTVRGGPDYGRFVEAIRTLQDHARAADAPDEVVTEAADLIEKASTLLAPYESDEWSSPAGRRMDLPNRGGVLGIPAEYRKTDDDRIRGDVRFRRFHLGRNGAVHGGCIAQLFDSLLGFTAFRLTRSLYQRTAFLHVDYRAIVPIETELQVDAGVDRVDGRKMFLTGRLLNGEAVLAEANALFVKLKPGQP
jgi:acyl-coenzyme A thioesterase PaaI-like protein